ncbi:hypothetical protein AAFF_G00066540 [Aldrovandia affinis]|uniref:Uncharacterized protein n=1 Tax=Aldrovandia affinis TaxID=143900 RepID=A0AAD7WY82_9TELE|nr:hypothetical protein AAFF_G00066540 [Aldrovandia affinis]
MMLRREQLEGPWGLKGRVLQGWDPQAQDLYGTHHKLFGYLEPASKVSARLPFRFKVHHIPGKENATADYLSRCSTEVPEEGECVMAAPNRRT